MQNIFDTNCLLFFLLISCDTLCLAVQEHIHNENARLEEEQQFWSKEIVVRIEYKFCPNLSIVDMPGEPQLI